MEIKYNDYGEPIYDTNYFDIKVVNDLCTGNIIVYKNNLCKISKILKMSKNYLRWIYATNVFTDVETDSVFYETEHILIPKIITVTNEFINMTKNTIELFNEEKNDVVEIAISLTIDKNIIEKINKNIKVGTEFRIKTIEFKNLIRMLEICQ